MNEYYTDYAEYLQRYFPGRKIQKISVNTGNGCPNRDGTLGTGGCIYCRNDAFTPGYCFASQDISAQIEAGRNFFRRKYPQMDFLVYFQSYTGTYRNSVGNLRKIYTEAMAHNDVAGLIIGTRPDCLPDELVAMLSELNSEKPVFVELGVESLHDCTLRLINRGHTAGQSDEAVRKLTAAGIPCGVHLILGLPGETREMMLETINRIAALPVESVKLHHLQVLRGTPLGRMAESGEIEISHFTVDEYADLCVDIIRRLPRRIAIERFLASAPPALVVSPRWGLKNYQFTNLLLNKLREK
ncbi:MAG: TIGR01212 family radical SAM protein [Muribaculaceae bacterium]|nr:TIGR01212 family radical SAM protein [Muribaculaceae bacterium]